MHVVPQPVLWHIEISHYNEKARWALAHKGVEHERRAPTPGAHMVVALWLTRGRHKTFPVLQLDGEGIGDSTAIIAALEERYPDPPLYPEDPDERRRALELEDFFDEELGPHARLLAFHEATKDPAIVERFTVDLLPRRLADVGPGPRRRGALLLGVHGASLRRQERPAGGAREGKDRSPPSIGSNRSSASAITWWARVHGRRPDGRVAAVPAGAAAGGAVASAPARGIRALPGAAQGPPGLQVGRRRCSAAIASCEGTASRLVAT